MTKKKIPVRDAVMLTVLLVLAVFAGVQTYQVQEMRERFEVTEDAVSAPPTVSGVNEQVQSLNDLPQMVGGC